MHQNLFAIKISKFNLNLKFICNQLGSTKFWTKPTKWRCNRKTKQCKEWQWKQRLNRRFAYWFMFETRQNQKYLMTSIHISLVCIFYPLQFWSTILTLYWHKSSSFGLENGLNQQKMTAQSIVLVVDYYPA